MKVVKIERKENKMDSIKKSSGFSCAKIGFLFL